MKCRRGRRIGRRRGFEKRSRNGSRISRHDLRRSAQHPVTASAEIEDDGTILNNRCGCVNGSRVMMVVDDRLCCLRLGPLVGR